MRAVAAVLTIAAMAVSAPHVLAREITPVTAVSPEGRVLVERLRRGGLVLFFRHADTVGMPCDRSFRVGDRAGQRNISETGRRQSRRIGEAMAGLGIPYARPVLAGPVFRAADTAIEAFGRDAVRIEEGLTADDYAGPRLGWVLDEHRRLLSTPPRAGTNSVLVGHRTPAIIVLGRTVGGRALPEGGAIVAEPTTPPQVLGIILFAPVEGAGFHGC
jgi:phosphohistidine phosphatase SixA